METLSEPEENDVGKQMRGYIIVNGGGALLQLVR